jgi:ankyrin repeat protein
LYKTSLTGNSSDFLEIVVAAAGRGDLETVRRLVDEKPVWIHTIGSHGRTMLWEAVYRGRDNVVKFLVERGADVNAVGCYFSEHFVEISPYCVAMSKGRYKLAEYLLKNGANVDIHSAAYLGDYNTVSSFLDKNPDLVNEEHPYTKRHDKPYFRATPIFYAVSSGYANVVELLISRGTDIQSYSNNLLGFAMQRGIEIVRLLLENGLDLSKIKMGPPPKDRKLAELLESCGVEFDVNASDRGWPPIVYRSRGDKGEHPEEIQRLLDLGADVNIHNYKGKTALHVAAKAGFVRVMEVLVNNGADVNAVDDNGETPIFDVVRSTIKNTTKKKSAASFLLSRGADLSIENSKGETPIEIAKKGRREEADDILTMLKEAQCF